jgi:hypothetical protein
MTKLLRGTRWAGHADLLRWVMNVIVDTRVAAGCTVPSLIIAYAEPGLGITLAPSMTVNTRTRIVIIIVIIALPGLNEHTSLFCAAPHISVITHADVLLSFHFTVRVGFTLTVFTLTTLR